MNKNKLDDYPLALAYRWKCEERPSGSLFYMYPPENKHLERINVSALNPNNLNPGAAEFAFHRSLPQRDKLSQQELRHLNLAKTEDAA